MSGEATRIQHEDGLQRIAAAAWRVLKQANKQRKAVAQARQSKSSGQ